MPRIDQQQYKSADHRSDDRSETRNQICDSADDRNQTYILHSADRHEDRGCAAHYDAVKEREHDIAHQDIVASRHEIQHDIIPLLRHERPHQALAPAFDRILSQKKVYRQDRGDQQIEDRPADIRGSTEDPPQGSTQKLGSCPEQILRRSHHTLQLRSDIKCPYVKALDQQIQPGDIAVHVADQQDDAPDQLGDQHKQKSRQEQEHHDHSHKYRERPFKSLAPDSLKYPFLKRGRQRIDEIRDHTSVKNGHKVSADVPQKSVYDI